jgi:hypothetical protein
MIPPLKPVIVIGFREESQPKGCGYLFWRIDSEKTERRVCDCDLFETSPEVVRPMFGKVLSQIIRYLGLPQHHICGLEMRYENMSPLAVDLLAQEFQGMDSEYAGNTVPPAVEGLDSGRLE